MVRGLDRSCEYFKGYLDNYVIIGGTACDVLLSEEGFVPRTTKDIDIILVVENLTAGFVQRLWEFLRAGGYVHLITPMKKTGRAPSTEIGARPISRNAMQPS